MAMGLRPCTVFYNLSNKSKTNMEKLKFNGEELELKFGAKALNGIEKESGKLIKDLGQTTEINGTPSTMFSLEEIILMLKHGLGNNRSDDECADIVDANDGCFFVIGMACLEAYNKLFQVATAGNSESPQA
jgi:hypothetical protein